MPCTYYLPGEEAEIRRKEAVEKLDEVTRLLCTVIRKHPELLDESRNLKKWARAHAVVDSKRKKNASPKKYR